MQNLAMIPGMSPRPRLAAACRKNERSTSYSKAFFLYRSPSNDAALKDESEFLTFFSLQIVSTVFLEPSQEECGRSIPLLRPHLTLLIKPQTLQRAVIHKESLPFLQTRPGNEI